MKKRFEVATSTAVAVTLVVLVLLVAAVTTYVHFGTHALPRSSIAGHDVSGQSRDQVGRTLDALLDQQSVQVVGPDGVVTPVNFAEAGVSVDVPATVDQVFQRNEQFAGRIFGLFSSSNVSPVVVSDRAQLESFVDGIEFLGEVKPVDASVEFDGTKKAFEASDSSPGTVLDAQDLETQLRDAAATTGNKTIYASAVAVEPEVSTSAAQEAANQANQLLQLPISIAANEQDKRLADAETIASWIEFEAAGSSLTPLIDADAVTDWVTGVADEASTDPVAGIQNVDTNGQVVAVVFEGRPGTSANNIDQVSAGLLTALDTDTAFTGELDFSVVEQSFEQWPLAEGAEDLVYQAAPGERWIDVNMSTYAVTAYEGSTPVLRIPAVYGKPSTPTPTGNFAIYAKIPVQDMNSPNPDGTFDFVPGVPWILYYDGSFAVHGAPWRSAFGYDAGEDGSHGCSNIPPTAAERLYEWASVGDTVIVHY